jgi:large subunit ribosomal protein L23
MQKELVLIRPIITEKTMLKAQDGVFTFMVHPKANKRQIAEVVEEQFKVHVIDVKTQSIKGKVRRFGKRRLQSTLSDYKKALVKLKKGENIELFDVSTEEK